MSDLWQWVCVAAYGGVAYLWGKKAERDDTLRWLTIVETDTNLARRYMNRNKT